MPPKSHPGLHPPPRPVGCPSEPLGSRITVISAPTESVFAAPLATPVLAPVSSGVSRSESDGQVGQAGPAVLPIRSQSIPGNSTAVRLPPIPALPSATPGLGQKPPTILPPISNEPELNNAEDNPFMRAAEAMEGRTLWKEVFDAEIWPGNVLFHRFRSRPSPLHDNLALFPFSFFSRSLCLSASAPRAREIARTPFYGFGDIL